MTVPLPDNNINVACASLIPYTFFYRSRALEQIISSTVISHTQLSYGILCRMQHSWHPLWTNLNHWPKAITTKQQTSVCK
jgi:hypothetical protein